MKNKNIKTLVTILTVLLVLFGVQQLISNEDLNWKRELVRSNPKLHSLGLTSVVGPGEFKNFLKTYADKPEIYERGDNFMANLHIHTIYSEAQLTPEEVLNQAAAYADTNNKKVWVAITDYNTTRGAAKAIEILNANPKKYKNVKFVPGIEIYVQERGKGSYELTDVRLLSYGINPYSSSVNTTIFRGQWRQLNLENALRLISGDGITGIAHPALFVESYPDKESYFSELLSKYRRSNLGDVDFVEEYFQSYPQFEVDSNTINELNNVLKQEESLLRSGGFASNNKSILSF